MTTSHDDPVPSAPERAAADVTTSARVEAIDWSTRARELQPISHSRLITVGAEQGIFTAISGAADPDTSATNLEAVVAALRAELERLEDQNLALRRQVEVLEAERKRTPDDFASAVSHTLDTLQTRLAETKNPVSRFAVKSFNIEANVYVDVSPLGTIDYRFAQPGDPVDAGRLSKIRLDLVPLPKDDDTGTWTRTDFTPQVDVKEIQGIGEAYQRQLNTNQIYSVGDLLTARTRLRSDLKLAGLLGVEREQLSAWLAHAELLTIKSIDGRQAEVLHGLGIANLSQLAAQDPAALTAAFNARVASSGIAALKPTTEAAVKTWITTAAAYAGRVGREDATADPADSTSGQ
jgi:predicted flap endonuclease-1-like 5' DNA nuclease